MTDQEAIEYLLNRYLVVGSPLNPPKEECERHNTAIDRAIAALKKQIPAELVHHDNCGNRTASARCPRCFEIVSNDYCGYCGQRVK